MHGMAPNIASQSLADQPWFSDFLKARGFERVTPNSFSNGRAMVRLEGTTLYTLPGEGKPWKSELKDASPDAIRQLLSAVLAAPSFLSQAELDSRMVRQQAAETALLEIAAAIREHPDTHSGLRLRQFVWSLFNGHHAVNLWRMKDVLDSRHNALVREVFSAWMEGFVPEQTLRRTLTESGEMDRWDAIRLGAPELQRLAVAMDAVTDLLNSTPPGNAASRLAPANEQLHQAADLLRQARSTD